MPLLKVILVKFAETDFMAQIEPLIGQLWMTLARNYPPVQALEDQALETKWALWLSVKVPSLLSEARRIAIDKWNGQDEIQYLSTGKPTQNCRSPKSHPGNTTTAGAQICTS